MKEWIHLKTQRMTYLNLFFGYMLIINLFFLFIIKTSKYEKKLQKEEGVFITLTLIFLSIYIGLKIIILIQKMKILYMKKRGILIDATYEDYDIKLRSGGWSTYRYKIVYKMKSQRKYTYWSKWYHDIGYTIDRGSPCKLIFYKNKLYLDESSLQFISYAELRNKQPEFVGKSNREVYDELQKRLEKLNKK